MVACWSDTRWRTWDGLRKPAMNTHGWGWPKWRRWETGMLILTHTALVPMLCNTGDGPACWGGIYTPLAQWELTVSKYHVAFALTHPKTQLSVCLCSREKEQPSSLIRVCNICFSLLATFLQYWKTLVCWKWSFCYQQLPVECAFVEHPVPLHRTCSAL